jgi:hypothetical protein
MALHAQEPRVIRAAVDRESHGVRSRQLAPEKEAVECGHESQVRRVFHCLRDR